MTDKITVVTATIANDTESACASYVVSEGETIEQALEIAIESATENFNDNGLSWNGSRTFHTVITFPVPKNPSTEIRAELPELPEAPATEGVTVEVK